MKEGITSHASWAKRLREAATNRAAISPLTSAAPELTLEDGYAIQKIGLEMALAEGRALCGYKMGLTSKAKQRDVNVFDPIHGYLLRDMEVENGGKCDLTGRIHPRAEPEVAVILHTAIEGPSTTLREVQCALGSVFPAIEILDSRFEAFSFKLPDVVADNTSAAGFLLGSRDLISELPTLPLLGVSIKKNGIVVETGAPAAVLGDPLRSVVALAKLLSREGKRIEPGMVILTGGITASVPFVSGDLVEAVFPTETLSFRAV
jgi:2-oxo-3-hexenedioate decarboxylase